jgi:hypothetical protein
VGLFNIYCSHTGVVLDHIQRAVLQQGLECEQVPARAQIGDRKGMPEAVWVAGLYSSLRTQCVDHLPQGVSTRTPCALVREQWSRRKIALLPVNEVAPQRLPGSFAQARRSPVPADLIGCNSQNAAFVVLDLCRCIPIPECFMKILGQVFCKMVQIGRSGYQNQDHQAGGSVRKPHVGRCRLKSLSGGRSYG